MTNDGGRPNPYIGARPFERTGEDERRFFARDVELEETIALLHIQPILLIYAQSGTGKTSLFNAGMVPALAEAGFRVLLPPARVGGAVPHAVEEDETNLYVYNALLSLAPDEDPSRLRRLTLPEFLERDRLAHDPPDDKDSQEALRVPTVLAFDQFEEIFALHSANSHSHQEEFFRQIGEALDADPLLRVVLLMREDYLAQIEPFVDFLPGSLRARYRLELLSPEAALDAVVRPVERIADAQVSFAPSVAESLVGELRMVRAEDETGQVRTIEGPYVEPVQLQVVCESLWAHLPPGTDTITHQHLREFGDVDQALTDLYEMAIDEAARGSVTERRMRAWFEERLITPMRTRGTVVRGAVDTGGIPNATVDQLVDAHIIRAEQRAGARWYELVHDRFIDPILASNERRKNLITDPAREWRRLGRDPGSLLRGERLHSLAAWAKQHPDALDDLESQFLTASLEAAQQAEREAEEADRLRRLVADLERQRQMSRTYELVAAANGSLPGDPERSVLLALYAVSISPPDRRMQAEVRDALARSLLGLRIALAIRGHDGAVNCVAFSRDGNMLVTGGSDATARIWDAVSGQELGLLQHDREVSGVAFSPDGKQIATASQDGTSLIWDAATANKLRSMAHNGVSLTSLTWSDDGTLLAAGDMDGAGHIWDARSGEQLLEIRHADAVWSVALSPDGGLLASASLDRTVRLWELPSGRRLRTFSHGLEVFGVAFSPDGRRVVTCSRDMTTKVWSCDTGKEELNLAGHTNTVMVARFSPDGSRLATGSYDRVAKLWDWPSGREREVLSGHADTVVDIAFSADGRRLATASTDGTARIWEPVYGQTALAFPEAGRIEDVAFSPDGSRLAVAVAKTVQVREAASGHLLARLVGHFGDVWALDFSPDGTRLATASEDSTLKLWDVTTGQDLLTLTDHNSAVFCVRFSPDGTLLASGDGIRRVRLRDPRHPHDARVFTCAGAVRAIAFSSDGHRLATGGDSREVEVWDVATGELAFSVLPGAQFVVSIAFGRGDETLAVADSEGKVTIWDTKTKLVRRTIDAHQSIVTSVVFTRDGAHLATGSWDFTAKLWDSATGDEELAIPRHDDKVTSIAFSPDGRLIATASADGMVRVNLVRMKDLVASARARVTRSLTLEECKRYMRQPDLEERPAQVRAIDYLVEGRMLAAAGRLDEAAERYAEALHLDPDIDLAPEEECRRVAGEVLRGKAWVRAAAKDTSGVVEILKAMVPLDPTLKLEPETEGRYLVAVELLDEAYRQALAGDVTGSVDGFTRAAALYPAVALDANREARRLAAVSLVQQGWQLVSREPLKAMGTYKQALQIHSDITIPPILWNGVCWFGALEGHAAEVIPACELAAAMPGGVGRDSRGLARALVGDREGAIEDFRAYIEWAGRVDEPQSRIQRREDWIVALEAGSSPFDAATIEDLRNE
jgi:WD40 repeat protein/tetratricopeptide (TPR) repeat protein